MEEAKENMNAWTPQSKPPVSIDDWKGNMMYFITRMRKEMDELLNQWDRLVPGPYPALSKQSLQLSRMWLGKVLGAMGKDYPYPDSTNPGSKVIEKATDKADEIIYTRYRTFTTCLEVVKELRSNLKAFVPAILSVYSNILQECHIFNEFAIQNGNPAINIDETRMDLYEAMRHCQESIMWLGMELNNIGAVRENELNPPPGYGTIDPGCQLPLY